MKSLRYSLISLVITFAALEAEACSVSWYTPTGYFMYRIYDKYDASLKELKEGHTAQSLINCKEWQELTSNSIPPDDIYKAVYKMPLNEFEAVYDNPNVTYENKFIEWITKKDTEILDFLYLAKTNEYIRLKCSSRWYYPSMRIGSRMNLEEVVERALSSKSERLRDRYLLQAVRALFTLSRFNECIDIWEKEAAHLPEDNLMRSMIQPYIAGAEFRTGHTEKAMEQFAQLGDVQSMLFCSGRADEKLSTVDALELVCRYAPESKYIVKALQFHIGELEPDGDFYYPCETGFTAEEKRLTTLCLAMAHDSRITNPAMWYYTAAFLCDRNDETQKADSLLRLAEKSKSSAYIDGSIKVFRMYLDAKLKPYDSAYENQLFKQLQWLDSMICNNIDEEVRETTASGYKLSVGISYYYWNDMLRRILLAEVCPRMIEAGKTTRAMQLANMAANRLLEVVDRKYSDYYKGDNVYTINAYRYSADKYNAHDYSNHFFEMIDSLGLNAAIGYVDNVKNPKTDFDRFLNERGYTGNDYLNEILGTQCLRNMRYADAVKYLGSVGYSYRHHHNLELNYDPFAIEKIYKKNNGDFKYEFAREMHSLEQEIEHTTEPNRKALLMIKYAIGIRNSFSHCWALTQYYWGTSFYGQTCEKRNWENDMYTTNAISKAKAMIDLACTMFTDDELAAEVQYSFCNFRTVANKYGDTPKGQLVRGQCDNLYNHHAESYKPISYRWWR